MLNLEFKNALTDQEPTLSIFVIMPTISKFKKFSPVVVKAQDCSE